MYLQAHTRIVSALLIREMSTRFGSKPGGYIWALLDPAAHVALLTLLFQVIARAPALGTSFPLFFATGYIAFNFYSSTVNYLSSAVKGNKALLNYPNVAPIDTVTARFFLQFGTMSVVAFIILGAILLTLHNAPALNWLAILEATTAASLLALGIGMGNAVLFARSALYEKIYGIVTKPLMLMSGVFFLPDHIPHPFREVLLLNPIVHVVILFRTGFYPEYRGDALNIDYMYTFIFCALFLGMLIFTRSSRVLRNE
ncbi:ABC transporter permease [Rhizobium sp. CG5]|uniref:ABC transporter permease n=1 Tax=Rhizobium sp. CG5 TaxID=2726076 RepID=UPI0020347C18|nr:ABC transporter permease [Rhizobium sp. CG5]MCM2477157.1 ABC transporter permease [Rhizobium sp. CG5]